MFLSAPALAGASSFGSKGSGDGQFNEPTGVAVNETSGDVYVVDKGNNRVEYFSSSGEYEGQFDGSEAPTGAFSSPEGIAVDNSCVGGTLECADESVLDVYVVDTGHHVIDKFSPGGKYLGQLTGTGPLDSFSGELGLAVDPSGDVWVDEENGTVDEFNNGKSNLFLSKRSMGFALNPGIAVDGEAHVYVIDAEGDVNFEKEELSIGYRTPPAPPCHCDTGVAVDTGGDVYVDERTGAREYTRKEGLIATPFSSGELTGGVGIAVNSGTGPTFNPAGAGDVYVADTAADMVRIFNPHGARIEACGGGGGVQPQVIIVGEGTKLCAVVNPNGESIEGCRFEFGETSAYSNVFPCSPEPPYTGGQVQVEASLSGLRPGATYHYRVVLTTKNGTLDGSDHEFSTPPVPPTVNGESLSGITQNDATLEATINPGGQAVRYQFQLVSNSDEYRSEIDCPPHPGPPFVCIGEHVTEALPIGFIEKGSEPKSVTLDLASAGVTLAPGTIYHYRVLVTKSVATEDTIQWEGPPVYGANETFTTPARARPLGNENETSSPTPSSSGGGQPTSGATSGPAAGSSSLGTGKAQPKPPTREQKLARALKQCKKEPKRKRAECKKRAHQKYAPAKKKGKKK
ncbi:MAG: NHL repeat-containing protein [Solirubrobacterales bacterium]